MEEIKNPFSNDIQKTVLKLFFPGILATWPIGISILKYIHSNSFWIDIMKGHLVSALIYIILLIIIYGVGHLINKIGIQIEAYLDSEYQKLDSTFKETWYKYLQKKFKNDETPIIIRYYSSFITAYHFELGCIVALIFQIVLLLSFDLFYLHLFTWWGLMIVIGISITTIIYLWFEANNSVEEAHNLRKKMIEINA
jgi:hypothetical protein